MINDKTLKQAIEEFHEEHHDSDICEEYHDKYYKAILYVCLEEVSGDLISLSNDFAIMVVNNDCLSFYVLDQLGFKLNILYELILPYKSISKLKFRKFLIWNNLKIRFINNMNEKYNDEEYELKVKFSDKVFGIKKQKENIGILLNSLKPFHL